MKKIYVISDLHGRENAFFKMLEKISFSDEDVMYVIGDVGDRGPDGIKLLQYIMKQKNIHLLMGNHEDMMLESLDEEDEMYMSNWMYNGGGDTYKALMELSKEERMACIQYVRDLPLYHALKVNGITYLLVHAGIVPSKDMMDLETAKADRDDLLWVRREFLQSDLIMPYTIIFGHTPTPALIRYADGLSEENKQCCMDAKMVHWRNRIAIDCGAGFGKNLGCLRLNDMVEFYVPIEN